MKEAVYSKLMIIQSSLDCPKNQRNDFGKYNYRSCEDIVEAVKPLLKEHGCILTLSDEMKEVGGRVYVEATANITCTDTGHSVTVSASAREAESQKGMADSQLTGATSSYARKYALNGLFAIDDTKDADTQAPPKELPIQTHTFLNKMAKARKAVGDEYYTEGLASYQCKTAEEIKPKDQEEILNDFRKHLEKEKNNGI
jgi:hypothetical protein